MVRYERATTDKQRRYAIVAALNALRALQSVVEGMRVDLTVRDAA
jgi:hypothetical protein